MIALVIADDEICKTIPGEGKADILISCGDVWDETILKAGFHYGCRILFAVKGNHDGSSSFPKPIHNLHFSVESFGGITFAGFEGSWRYKPKGNYLYDQEEVSTRLRAFPRVDVFVAHNSPRGIHERGDDVHQGFDAFLEYIHRAQPAYFIHGHQHIDQVTTIGCTQVMGVYGKKLAAIVKPG